jgi:flagellin-like hook-associated protein FlgL
MIGNGDGTFEESTNIVMHDIPSSISTADLNNDGYLDLIAPSYWLNYVEVRLGNGDGTFAQQSSYIVGDDPRQVSAIDITGDGISDLVVSNSASASISVLVGNGDGTFREQSVHSVGLVPTSHTINDFNSDGVPDIASSNDSSDTISLLIADTTESVRLTYVHLTEQDLARSAVGVFKEALERIGQEQAAIGAVQSRLQSVLSHLGGLADNYQAAAGKILDINTAEEIATLVRYKIIQQAGTAILGQANQTVSLVKRLLDF